MKHVSKSTWERLKEESAADLYDELHHDGHGGGAVTTSGAAHPPAEVHQPEDS
ncbi:hypothetical protein [Cryobacterium sp. MLB-32]|uniref:hypothetical protein n=1 Tax=Cryobacterium sp. MLB-32 TaxID=1529318 RepID=UPI0012E004C8|nr:hypothetical protein [Cryobacterium sp. MLB-32]